MPSFKDMYAVKEHGDRYVLYRCGEFNRDLARKKEELLAQIRAQGTEVVPFKLQVYSKGKKKKEVKKKRAGAGSAEGGVDRKTSSLPVVQDKPSLGDLSSGQKPVVVAKKENSARKRDRGDEKEVSAVRLLGGEGEDLATPRSGKVGAQRVKKHKTENGSKTPEDSQVNKEGKISKNGVNGMESMQMQEGANPGAKAVDGCKKDVADSHMHDRPEDGWCAYCDNGGELLMCDGPCCRSFHIPKERSDGCNPLEISWKLACAILASTEPFLCPNCFLEKQQCFSCKNVGQSVGTEASVFKCCCGWCARFYCRTCIAKMDKHEKTFICPQHNCGKCGRGEFDAAEDPLVICRRCPLSLHLKCMPKDIHDGPARRVWLVDRDDNGEVFEESEALVNQFFCPKHKSSEQHFIHERPLFTRAILKQWEQQYLSKYGLDMPNRLRENIPRRKQIQQLPLIPLEENKSFRPLRVSLGKFEAKTEVDHTPSMGTRSNQGRSVNKRPLPAPEDIDLGALLKPSSQSTAKVAKLISQCEEEHTLADEKKRVVVFPPYDKELRPKLTPEDVENWSRRAANGTADIQALSEICHAMQLRLTPLLCDGGRYTSYGRHFTNTNILMEIVTRVIPFLAQGDLIVDCSCGANEWLEIMRNTCKVENLEIKCKGYDPFTPYYKEDWIRGSWLGVTKEDLADGDQLVIGLNPPFGVKGVLATRFMEHAVSFEPRVIALIAPDCTPVPPGYTVQTEDYTLCSDKSFYIPGLRKQSWNKKPPPFRIYLRDRPPSKVLVSWEDKQFEKERELAATG